MKWCERHDIIFESYSLLSGWPYLLNSANDPLGGNIFLFSKFPLYLLDSSLSVKAIAESKGKTSHQIVIRWALQNKISVIPRSTHPPHMRENLDVFDFDLTNREMAILNGLRHMIASPIFHSQMEKSDNIFDVKYDTASNFHSYECRDPQARTVTFVDECPEEASHEIYWINHEGAKIFVENLRSESVINSFIGHVFECRNQRYEVTHDRTQIVTFGCL